MKASFWMLLFFLFSNCNALRKIRPNRLVLVTFTGTCQDKTVLEMKNFCNIHGWNATDLLSECDNHRSQVVELLQQTIKSKEFGRHTLQLSASAYKHSLKIGSKSIVTKYPLLSENDPGISEKLADGQMHFTPQWSTILNELGNDTLFVAVPKIIGNSTVSTIVSPDINDFIHFGKIPANLIHPDIHQKPFTTGDALLGFLVGCSEKKKYEDGRVYWQIQFHIEVNTELPSRTKDALMVITPKLVDRI